MENKMETTIMGSSGTSIRINPFIPKQSLTTSNKPQWAAILSHNRLNPNCLKLWGRDELAAHSAHNIVARSEKFEPRTRALRVQLHRVSIRLIQGSCIEFTRVYRA